MDFHCIAHMFRRQSLGLNEQVKLGKRLNILSSAETIRFLYIAGEKWNLLHWRRAARRPWWISRTMTMLCFFPSTPMRKNGRKTLRLLRQIHRAKSLQPYQFLLPLPWNIEAEERLYKGIFRACSKLLIECPGKATLELTLLWNCCCNLYVNLFVFFCCMRAFLGAAICCSRSTMDVWKVACVRSNWRVHEPGHRSKKWSVIDGMGWVVDWLIDWLNVLLINRSNDWLFDWSIAG